MIFRTVSAIAALMICVGALGGRALAQHYPPAQPYPPSLVYPPEGYYPRQGYPPLPPVVDDDADADVLYDLPDRRLPPGPRGGAAKIQRIAQDAPRWPERNTKGREGRDCAGSPQHGRRAARHVLSWSGWRPFEGPATASIQNEPRRLKQ